MAHTPQSRRVRDAELASHDRDVYPKRQKVELGEEAVERLREIVREEIRAELMRRDRRSGSGD